MSLRKIMHNCNVWNILAQTENYIMLRSKVKFLIIPKATHTDLVELLDTMNINGYEPIIHSTDPYVEVIFKKVK